MHHQNQVQTSPIFFLPAGQNQTHVGFEFQIDIFESFEIEFKLVEVQEERSESTAGIFNLLSTIGKKKGRSIIKSLSMYNMTDESMGKRKESKLSPVSDRQTISLVGDCKINPASIKTTSGCIMEKTVKFNNEKKVVGRMHVRHVSIPAPNGDSILPRTLSEVEDAFTLLSLHRRVWKKGYMYQCGGDTSVSLSWI